MLGWRQRLVLVVVWVRWVSRVLLDLACRVVRVVLVWVVLRLRWLLVLVVPAVRVGLLVVWLARSVPVLVVGVGLVRKVRGGVVVYHVMHTRVLLLVVRWVLVRALPVLVWALVVVLLVSVLVCQVVRARCRVRQRRLVPLLVRAVVVPVV